MEFVLCSILFCAGLYAVICKRNLIKIVIGVAVMGYSVNLYFILAGFRFSSAFPIIEKETMGRHMVDPLAQAIVLASVIAGLAVTLLLTALSLKLHGKYGTFDIDEIKKLKG